MKPGRLRLLLIVTLLLPWVGMRAEKVADLAMPTRYVNDFAGVLTPAIAEQIESLCREVHDQAKADIAVVTIKTLDDESVEEFSSSLEEKWKIGQKGSDRGALVVLVLNPHKIRIETGYGLEGILPDAKVGRIRDQAIPFATAGNYDQAILTMVQGLADAIAADAHVALTPATPQDAPQQRTYHRQAQPQGLGMGQVLLGIGVILLIVIMIATGNGGWLVYILLSMLGGGGRGGGGGGFGGGGGGGGGGDFGGSGGGESGGGGASGDY